MGLPTPTSTRTEEYQVVIVGGGPVGLWLALKLVRHGLRVCVLEAGDAISQSPRALMYMPIILHEFEKVDILDEIVQAGHKNTEGLCFRTTPDKGNKALATAMITQLPRGEHHFDYAGVQLGQPRLAEILLRHAQQHTNFIMKFNHQVMGIKEESDGVNLSITSPTGEIFMKADFVAGCDGGSSAVRRALCIPFGGFTWNDWRFVAINIEYDFDKFGGYPAANQIVDPEDWAVIARAGNEREHLWRISTGMPAALSTEEIHDKIHDKLERLLPGPRPLKYRIQAINPYTAHERVADQFRSGRVVLCGDAAHVTNPLAGLGLTTGLLDVVVLAPALVKAVASDRREEWEVLLDHYAESRRKAFVEFTQKESIATKIRIHSMEPEVIKQREGFFYMLNNKPEALKMFGYGMAQHLPG
ncbi:MAG: hypothetical protein M1817_000820 [Caeruleum heppii]|nr:MAG: hypothetical protein M1817_000820 [Caeruleum heppii]